MGEEEEEVVEEVLQGEETEGGGLRKLRGNETHKPLYVPTLSLSYPGAGEGSVCAESWRGLLR